MNDNKAIARLLRLLADSIERSSPADFEALLAGEGIIRLVEKGLGRSKRGSQRSHDWPPKQATKTDLVVLADRLRRLQSRDEGLDLLENSSLGKKQLEQLARLMDLPVAREDDVEHLRNKIVEASIGSRLNSQAIRGAS